jgi:hypothetical protein
MARARHKNDERRQAVDAGTEQIEDSAEGLGVASAEVVNLTCQDLHKGRALRRHSSLHTAFLSLP